MKSWALLLVMYNLGSPYWTFVEHIITSAAWWANYRLLKKSLWKIIAFDMMWFHYKWIRYCHICALCKWSLSQWVRDHSCLLSWVVNRSSTKALEQTTMRYRSNQNHLCVLSALTHCCTLCLLIKGKTKLEQNNTTFSLVKISTILLIWEQNLYH